MKDLQGARWFRLATKPDGVRMRCDENGAFWGPVGLFTRTANTIDRQWVPRAVSQLNRELTVLSELPIDLTSKRDGLNAVARALNAGNIALAQVAMLNLHLPDLPDLQKATASAHLLPIALDLWASGILKNAEFDPAKHPRWPRGAPASQGGRFRAANDNDQVNAGDSPIVVAGLTRHERCINKCLHLLKSPSGDLQSSEFRKCYGECMGRL